LHIFIQTSANMHTKNIVILKKIIIFLLLPRRDSFVIYIKYLKTPRNLLNLTFKLIFCFLLSSHIFTFSLFSYCFYHLHRLHYCDLIQHQIRRIVFSISCEYCHIFLWLQHHLFGIFLWEKWFIYASKMKLKIINKWTLLLFVLVFLSIIQFIISSLFVFVMFTRYRLEEGVLYLCFDW